LRNFAEKSGGRYIDSPGGQTLRDAFASIAEELGHQYTIAYRPTNHAHDGKWRAIGVKLSKADVTVRTRKGYKAPKGHKTLPALQSLCAGQPSPCQSILPRLTAHPVMQFHPPAQIGHFIC
jgi:hypothetical protein